NGNGTDNSGFEFPQIHKLMEQNPPVGVARSRLLGAGQAGGCAPVLLFVHRSFLGDHPISAWPQFADQTARGQDCVTFQDAIINGRIEIRSQLRGVVTSSARWRSPPATRSAAE